MQKILLRFAFSENKTHETAAKGALYKSTCSDVYEHRWDVSRTEPVAKTRPHPEPIDCERNLVGIATKANRNCYYRSKGESVSS